MTTTIAGHCGKCGAPYTVPSIWHGVTAPPKTPSCSCWNTPKIEVSDGSNIVWEQDPGEIPSFALISQERLDALMNIFESSKEAYEEMMLESTEYNYSLEGALGDLYMKIEELKTILSNEDKTS